MAFTGQGGDWSQAREEIDEDKEAKLDPWAKSQFPEEEAATKALDGLRLTPTPGETPTASPTTPAVQEPVPRTSFTDVRRAAAALRNALRNALDPSKKYGTITRAHDGARGDKRWKIEYGDVVYITDARQKLVITTYQLRPRVDSIYIGPDPPPPTYPPPMYMPPAPYMPPIVEGPIPLFQPPPPMILRSAARPVKPLVVKFCAACGKSLRKAAFSKTQWRTYPNRPRCNVCTNFGRVPVAVPPLPATVAVSVSTAASSATVSVSIAP